MQINNEFKLYNSDSLKYEGSIIQEGQEWKYKDVNNDHLVEVTKGMPLKAVLSNLIFFDLVYDVIEPE